MSDWIVKVTEEAINTKTFTLSKEDFATQEEANKYLAVALENFGFDEFDKYPTVVDEYSLSINGEDQDYWLD